MYHLVTDVDETHAYGEDDCDDQDTTGCQEHMQHADALWLLGIHMCVCSNDNDNLYVYLASRHQVHAMQVSSLQTGLFRASQV